jgi:hypothetical protein
MQPSPATIGIVMIGLGLIPSALALHAGGTVTLIGSFAALPLLVGGVAVLLRRPASFWIAQAGGAVTAIAGGAGVLSDRQIGLPLQPLVVLVLGLYVCFRIAIARPSLSPRPPRRMIADELFDDPASRGAGPPDTPDGR